MKVDELLAKIEGNATAKEALGADVLKELSGLGSIVSDFEKKLKDAEAKAGRILSEKKEALEKLNALESDVETLKKSGMSEADKIKSEYDKALKRAEKAEKDLAGLNAEFAKAKRTVALDKIANQVKFIDAVTPEAGRILLESALANVQALDDADAVNAALTAFKDGYKTLIAAENQGTGAGTGRPGAGGAGQAAGKTPDKMTAEERAADLKKRGIV